MFQRTFLTGLAITLLAAQACGSDDGKKKVVASDGGMGGEGSPAEPASGGSSAGAPVETAGEPGTVLPTGGTGSAGEAPIEPTAGAAGQPSPPILPDPELLFAVKPGAVGLANTELNAAATKENFIYTSKTGSQDAVDGTNAVKITGVSMGLDATDQIVSFALVQPEPASPEYLFSVADGSEGASPTRVYQAYWDDPGTEEGKIYYSNAVQTYRNLGEGGDQYGYNALLASERSLGLSPGGGEDRPDDLTAIAVHDKHVPITELYFTVSGNAIGGTDTDVATVDATERACTVFKTGLDNKNKVAFSCSDLGLIAGDRIDALAVYGGVAPTKVVFSVNTAAQGAVGSAVEASQASGSVGATLFSSPGDGSNVVLVTDRDLGLGENVDDELDGLAVVDAPKTGAVVHATSCNVTYDPLDAVAGGGLVSVIGTSRIGQNIMVLYGQTAAQQNRVLAYNATSCAFLEQVDLPVGFDSLADKALVPLTGWVAAKPLDNIEYLQAAPDAAYGKELRRYDATGTLVTTFPISNTDNTNATSALVYDPVGDRLYMLFGAGYSGSNSRQRDVLAMFQRPAVGADPVSLVPIFSYLSLPCADEVDITGTDANGNLYVARSQSALPTDYKVCGFTPTGELLPAPFAWSSDTASYKGGFIVPGGSSFLLHSGTPMAIERGVYQP